MGFGHSPLKPLIKAYSTIPHGPVTPFSLHLCCNRKA